jgi:hypothetical protein
VLVELGVVLGVVLSVVVGGAGTVDVGTAVVEELVEVGAAVGRGTVAIVGADSDTAPPAA